MSAHSGLPAVEIEDVWKEYRLGSIGHGSFRQDFQSWWAKARGKEDPNRMVGEFGIATEQASDRFYALREINVQVGQGEMLGIVGRNGAGKSTLLKILSRVTAPTRGQVTIRGRMVSLLEVGTGFHPELTGRENVFLNGAIMGMKREEIRRKFDEIVEFSGIARFIDTPVKRYSSGMYVRLAFAVAAHLEPEILIVDEVLAVGDYDFQKKCMSKMGEVTMGSGRTVLFVSHNLGAVRKLCPRTMLLSHGKMIDVGPTAAIVDRYLNEVQNRESEFTQGTNPDKPMNLRRVRVVSTAGNTSLEVEYQDGFEVEIEYEVNFATRNCMIWTAVRTLDETEVFCTADYDSDMSLLGARQPGYYRTRFKVPGRLLNNGTYYLVIGIVSQAPEVSFDRIELQGLTITDTKSELTPEGMKRSGLVKPLLPWMTARISPPLHELR